MVSFPYYSHSTPIRIPKDMGIVWEAYHKGVPSLGVPGITLEIPDLGNDEFGYEIKLAFQSSLLFFGGDDKQRPQHFSTFDMLCIHIHNSGTPNDHREYPFK